MIPKYMEDVIQRLNYVLRDKNIDLLELDADTICARTCNDYADCDSKCPIYNTILIILTREKEKYLNDPRNLI